MFAVQEKLAVRFCRELLCYRAYISNDPEKVLNTVTINFDNYTEVYKAAKKKAYREELQEGLWGCGWVKWEMKFNASAK